ncbi:hypothetical protein N8I77_012175 [Diaporthe amygdali]|uniref:Uncharacterized protein n=1 Tax=Phomopsis amygdali TaxID=1214568 RepID=A0AAD9S476_PHOAM|nr:hypothetical protein N8I77_012175 [Diaporthe amygdali]
MFRQVAGRRALSMWPRRTAAAISSGEHVAVHKVRFQPRRDHIRKFFVYTSTALVCWYTWTTVINLPLKHLDMKDLPEVDEEEEEDPLFIPFPFTDKQVQPPPYAGKEEEWQSFVAFNNDREHRNRAKHDLAMLVKKTAENNAHIKRWGKQGMELKLGPNWLIITYPDRPPPEFVRTGIEISDDAISIKTQKVDTRTKTLVDRVLKPYPLATSSYAFIKAFFKQSTSDVVKLFGYSESHDISTSSPDPEIAKTLKRLEARQIAEGGAAAGSSPSATSSTSKTHPEVASSQKSAFPDAPPGQNPASAKSPDQSSREQDKSPVAKEAILAYPELVNKSQGPTAAFAQQWRRAWRPLKYYPPRGCVAIHGMVALESSKGRVYIDVSAWYNPKKREFHQESMQLGLKAISPNTQSPRR